MFNGLSLVYQIIRRNNSSYIYIQFKYYTTQYKLKMESEAYQDYLKSPRTRISLTMWILMNNNVVRMEHYIGFKLFDFAINLVVIIALFSHVDCLPPISQSIIEAIDFDDTQAIAVAAIALCCLLLTTFIVIAMLIVRSYHWETYTKKMLIFQVLSLTVTVLRMPFFSIVCLLTITNLSTFQSLQNSYLQYVSVICSIVNTSIMSIYCLVGAHLFNIQIPNNLLPWSNSSSQSYLLIKLSNLLLMLTFKFRETNLVLLYSLSFMTTVACIFRVYQSVYKSYILNDTVQKLSIVLDCAKTHLVLFFTLTLVYQGEHLYFLFVIFFMPVSCIAGYCLLSEVKNARLSLLMNDHQNKLSNDDLTLCFLYLIFLCQSGSEDSKQQLIRFQQVHFTRCEAYFYEARLKRLEVKQDQQAEELEYGKSFQSMVHKMQSGTSFIAENQSQSFFTDPKTSQEVPQMMQGNAHNTQEIYVNQKSRIELKQDDSQPPRIEQPLSKFNKTTNAPLENQKSSIKNSEDEHPDIKDQNHQQNKQLNNRFGNLFVKAIAKKSGTPFMKSSTNQSKASNLSRKKSMMTQNKQGMSFKPQSNAISEIFSEDGRRNQRKLKERSRVVEEEFNDDPINDESIAKQLNEFTHHLLNGHTVNQKKESSYLIKFINAFFVSQISKNPYLAQFMLLSCTDEDEKSSDILSSSAILINQRYIDDLNTKWYEQEEKANASRQQWDQIDLKTVLQISHMLNEFDNCLERISANIFEFWDNLLKQREAASIFDQGIVISEQLLHIQTLLQEIELKQSDKESSLYMKMAQFNNLVVFKQNECYIMVEKARMALQAKKLTRIREARDDDSNIGFAGSQEKCLIMTNINIKKPMKIEFINKAALKLLQYQLSDIVKISINQIMPLFVSDLHQVFLDEFMQSGVMRMMKQQKHHFAKLQSGFIIPITSFLSVNVLSRKHMILIFDQNTHFRLFDEQISDFPFTYMLAQKDYMIGEMAQNFEEVTGVPPWAIRYIKQELDRDLHIEHLLTLRSPVDLTVSHLSLVDMADKQEVEVSFERVYAIRDEQFHALQDEEEKGNYFESKETGSSMRKNLGMMLNTKGKETQQSFTDTPIFTMKVVDMIFMGGKHMIKILAFRKFIQRNPSSTNMIASYTEGNSGPQFGRIKDKNSNNMKTKHSRHDGVSSDGVDSNDRVDDIYGSKEEQSDYAELVSQTSSTSSKSNNLNTLSVLSTYIQKESNNATPKTLKFIMNMVLAVLAIIVIANSVVLDLATNNANSAANSVLVSKHSFEIVDEIVALRVVVRALANVNQGYLPNTGNYVKNRTDLYIKVIKFQSDNLQSDTLSLNGMTSNQKLGELSTQLGDPNPEKGFACWFLSENGDQYFQYQTLSRALELLAIDVEATVFSSQKTAHIIGQSELQILNFTARQTNQAPNQPTQPEINMFFILNNSNSQLYTEISSFSPFFVAQEINQIGTQLGYLRGTAIGVIALICLTAFIVVPLFGKIQVRILELMKMFFIIDVGLKKDMLKKIREFQEQYYRQQGGGINQRKKQFEQDLEQQQSKGKMVVRQNEDNNKQNGMVQTGGVTSQKLYSPSFGGAGSDQQDAMNDTTDGVIGESKTKIQTAFGVKNSKANRKLKYRVDEDNEQVEEAKSEDESESGDKQQSSNKSKLFEREVVEDAYYADPQLDSQSLNREKEMIAQFSQYINRRRFWQGLLVISLLIVIGSYYLISYLMSNTIFTNAQQGIRDLELIFGRYDCSQQLLNEFTQVFFVSDAQLAQYFKNIDSKISACMDIESVYLSSVINTHMPYMNDAITILQQLESGQVCSGNGMFVNSSDCLTLSQQLRTQGLSAFYFDIMKTIKQFVLDLEVAISNDNYNVQFMKQLLDSKISEFIDIVGIVVQPMHSEAESQSISSVVNYFTAQRTLLTIIFCCYMISTFIFVIIFFASSFKNLRREMLQSNRLLYIVDFESLKDTERTMILQFLVNY